MSQMEILEEHLAQGACTDECAWLADLYRQAGDLQKCWDLVEKSLERQPMSVPNLLVKAYCLVDMGRSAEARDAFADVLAQDDRCLAARAFLLEAALQTGRVDEARQISRRISLQDPWYVLQPVPESPPSVPQTESAAVAVAGVAGATVAFAPPEEDFFAGTGDIFSGQISGLSDDPAPAQVPLTVAEVDTAFDSLFSDSAPVADAGVEIPQSSSVSVESVPTVGATEQIIELTHAELDNAFDDLFAGSDDHPVDLSAPIEAPAESEVAQAIDTLLVDQPVEPDSVDKPLFESPAPQDLNLDDLFGDTPKAEAPVIQAEPDDVFDVLMDGDLLPVSNTESLGADAVIQDDLTSSVALSSTPDVSPFELEEMAVEAPVQAEVEDEVVVDSDSVEIGFDSLFGEAPDLANLELALAEPEVDSAPDLATNDSESEAVPELVIGETDLDSMPDLASELPVQTQQDSVAELDTIPELETNSLSDSGAVSEATLEIEEAPAQTEWTLDAPDMEQAESLSLFEDSHTLAPGEIEVSITDLNLSDLLDNGPDFDLGAEAPILPVPTPEIALAPLENMDLFEGMDLSPSTQESPELAMDSDSEPEHETVEHFMDEGMTLSLPVDMEDEDFAHAVEQEESEAQPEVADLIPVAAPAPSSPMSDLPGGQEVMTAFDDLFPDDVVAEPVTDAPEEISATEPAPAVEVEEEKTSTGLTGQTITLAEIYFNQGLYKQALNIYREVLAKKGGDASLEARVQEIESLLKSSQGNNEDV